MTAPIDVGALVASIKSQLQSGRMSILPAATPANPSHRRHSLAVTLSSAKMDYGTPAYVFDPLNAEFAFDFDAAATAKNALLPVFISPDMDCLKVDWRDFGKSAFLNPPYGRRLGRFTRKARESAASGIRVVTLTPARTGTGWFQRDIFGAAAEVVFVSGRIVFDGTPPDAKGRIPGAPFDAAIGIFDPGGRTGPLRVSTWDPVAGPERIRLV